jgi:signal transduction histidine kinase
MVAKIRKLFGSQHAMLLMVPKSDGLPCTCIMDPQVEMPVLRSLEEARALGSAVHRTAPLFQGRASREQLPPPIGGPGIGTLIAVPVRIGDQNVGALAVWHGSIDAYDQDYIDLLTLSAERLSTALERIRLQVDLRDSEARLRVLSHRLVGVQEAERRSLACELHGEIGQILTGLSMLLEREAESRPEPPSRPLTEAKALVTDLVARVREMSLRLRPSILDDLGLLPTLHWHCPRFSEATKIPVRLLQTGADRRFPPAIETTAYRIIQEALTNVARHAEATEVLVHLWADDTTLCLQVQDNGHGFDLATKDTSMSTGFSGMREQALQVGGNLLIDSSPGSGTCIAAELPLAPPVPATKKE